MRVRNYAVALLLLAACSNELQTKSQAEVEAKASATQASFLASAPAPSPSTEDPFAREYVSIREQIDQAEENEFAVNNARDRVKVILAKDRNYAPAYVALADAEVASMYLESTESKEEVDAALVRAKKFVNHALKLQPDNIDAHMQSAWVSLFQGDYEIAEESLRYVESLKPGYPEAKLVRAGIAIENQDIPGMVKLAKEVIAESGNVHDRVIAYNFMITGYRLGAHNDEADAAFKKLLELRPESAWAHGNYAGFLLQREDIDGAIREAETSMNIRKSPPVTATLARAYLKKAQEMWEANRIHESAALVEKVGNLANDEPELMYILGQFYEGAAVRGRDPSMRKKALASYQRALELDPKHREAERAVERLQ